MVAQRLRSAFLVAPLALVCVAAPAAAATPDRGAPEASDFTQPVPAADQLRERSPRAVRIAERRKGYGMEGPLLYRTPPIEAPRRFDLVGVAGEVHALEYRARKRGEAWSGWAEADNGDPVYTGGTDEVQVRSRTVPIEGELHYVDVDGSSAPAPRASDLERDAARDGRRPGVPKPHFVSRAEWGANDKKTGCEPRVKPLLGRVKAGVVHHTVSTNNYSEREAPGLVLGICRYHRNANGWNEIGYNALVDRFGNLYEGRAGGVDRAIVGAHAEGHNSQTAGVAVIGERSSVAPSGAERETLIRYLAWRLDVAGIDASGKTRLTSAGGSSTRTEKGGRIRVPRIISHSDTNFTECAGLKLRAQLPKIRRAVQGRIEDAGGTTSPPTDPGGGAPIPPG